MASYNELLALIDAYINQNGVQAITGQVLNGVLRAMVDQLGRGYAIMGAADPTTDPGTPDGPETWFASVPGTYTNFDGIQIVPGELALLSYEPSTGFSKNTIYEGFQTVQATIDGNVGTPAVGVSYANGILSFDFHNMKGVTGDPAGFGAVTASVDSNIGTPSVQVQTSGPDTAKAIAFQFHNLKGETGVTSVLATVDNTSGNPQCAVSLNGQQLVLNFTGLKGAQGDTGSSVDYPFTIVNNLTTDDATQALSAAMGVQLDGKVSQLEAEVDKSVECAFGYKREDHTTPTSSPLSVSDEAGNVLAKLGGHGLKTKYYDSELNARIFDSSTDNDLAIVDDWGYAIMVLKNGVARTKNTGERDGLQWQGKKWYAYGTSITNINNEGKYPNYLRDISGMLLTNKGISGGGIGNNLGGYSSGQVKTALMNITDGKLEADLITLETGANDVGPDTPLGTIYDTGDDTLAGCLNQCLRYLQANTTAQIVVFPSPAYNSSEFDAHYHEWQLLIRDICFINKVYFIDGENGMGWAKLHSSQRSLYIVDTIHHTELGGSLFAKSIWGQLKNIPLFATSLT